MRRRRRNLEVSTFPFLAVLLCAMGSLILVLLVMDRKAKQVARAKGQEKLARLLAEAARADADRRAEWEKKRQEARRAWEQKRDALHNRLLSEEEVLQAQMQKVRRDLAEAAARLRAEEEDLTGLRKRAREEGGRLLGVEKTLAGTRGAAAQAGGRTASAKSQLARMTAELAQLEQALKDLKAARERERQTYSVVPYRGRHGESRRPLYVECAAGGVVFHPDHLAMDVAGSPQRVRAEVEQRIARQRERLPPDAPRDGRAYLMLLVRPEGVLNYYHLQSALKGVPIDFGYEFIDSGWILDFPEDDTRPAAQPWMSVARADGSGSRPAPSAAQPHGVPINGLPPSPEPKNPAAPGSGAPGGRAGQWTTGGGGGTGTRGGAAPGPGVWGGGVAGGSPRAGPGGFGPGPAVAGAGTWERGGGGVGVPGGGASGGPSQAGRVGTGPGPGVAGVGSGTRAGGLPGSGLPNGGASGSSAQAGPGGIGSGPPVARSGPGGSGPGTGTSGGDGRSAALSPSTGYRGTGGPGGSGGPFGPPGGASSPGGGLFASGPTTSPGSIGVGGGSPGVPGTPGGSGVRGPGGMANASGAGGSGSAPDPLAPLAGQVSNLTNPTAPPGPGGQVGNLTYGPWNPPARQPAGGGSQFAVASAQGSNGYSSQAPSGTKASGAPPANREVIGQSPPPNPGPSDPAGQPPDGPPRRRRYYFGGGGDGDGDPDGMPLSRPGLGVPGAAPPRRRTAPLNPLWLHGNRDWVIYLECREDAVVLYPSQRRFPLSDLGPDPRPDNPLTRAVRQMIEHRQALLRPGEPPYRPEVRHLIWPNGVLAFHVAYPALEFLHVPQKQQPLRWDDDVEDIVTGP